LFASPNDNTKAQYTEVKCSEAQQKKGCPEGQPQFLI
jgi:hypothetical protein